MARLGKKILSAFMEVTEEKKDPDHSGDALSEGAPRVTAQRSDIQEAQQSPRQADQRSARQTDQRFTAYFDKLFSEANIPGPDYYEFSKMIGAMQVIPDEGSRYHAAFAGLQVQGLDKERLLSTAAEYLRVLTTDADHFQKTVEAAVQEKVNSPTTEAEEKARRIQALSQEILQLQEQINSMQAEINENRDKLMANSNAYAAENAQRKQQIQSDIEKINQYIH